jgi:hypothetical protein
MPVEGHAHPERDPPIFLVAHSSAHCLPEQKKRLEWPPRGPQSNGSPSKVLML